MAPAAHAGRAAQRLKFGLDLGSSSNLRRVVVVIVHVESGAEVGQREAQERAERDRAASMENKKAAGAGAAKAAALAYGSRHHPQCNVAAKSQAEEDRAVVLGPGEWQITCSAHQLAMPASMARYMSPRVSSGANSATA